MCQTFYIRILLKQAAAEEKMKNSQKQLMKRMQDRLRTLSDEKNKLQAELSSRKAASTEKDKQSEGKSKTPLLDTSILSACLLTNELNN